MADGSWRAVAAIKTVSKQMVQQLDLFEASHYHDVNRWGYFSILYRDNLNGKPSVRQESFPLNQMHKVIPLLGFPERRDYWISQADFSRRNRRAVNLAAIGVLFVDLDYYAIPSLQLMDRDRIAHLVLDRCKDLGSPVPSLVIDSGRGMQLKWFHEPLPRAALPRWHAVEDTLVRSFKDLGADQKVRDVSRVLRIAHSINQKNQKRVEIIHVEWGDKDEARKYAFDDLATAILPFSRKQVSEYRKHKVHRLIDRGKRKPSVEGLLPFDPKKLAWERLEDVRMLAKVRYGGEVPSGSRERDEFLFWAVNFAALNLWGRTSGFWHEAYQLAAELTPTLPKSEVLANLSTVWNKLQQMARSEWIEFNGWMFPPLYTPRNATLIERLRISEDEQRQLKTIIDKDLSRERDAARKREKRAEAGAVNREAYEANSLSRQKPWEALGISRTTWYRNKLAI